MTDHTDLRQKTEKFALEKASIENIDTLSPAKVKQMLHELRVHQIELEMQNEELRAAREALDLSHARYLDLYDFAPVGYITLSEQGLILEANLTAATLLGEPRGNMIKRPISGFILKEDQDIYYRHRKILFESGEPQKCELQMVKKDGLTFWAGLEATAVEGPDGVPACRVVLTDITGRKQAEKKNLFKENIIRSSACAIATCDLQGNMTYGNPFFQKLWGFDTPEEFIGNPFQKFWLPEDQYETIMKTIQSKRTWAGELKGIRKDGNLFDVHVSAAAVLDDTGTPMALTFTSVDITERKWAEAKFQQLQKVESLSRLAGAIAHHFNNQLQVVIGSLEITMDDLPKASEAKKNIVRAMKTAQKIAEMSRQMRVYLGQTSGKHEPIDLIEALRQSLSLLQAAIPKGIPLNVDFPGSGPVIRAQKGRIDEILTHLITNAWESISGNQGAIRLAVRTVSQDHIPALRRFPTDWQPQCIPHACIEVSDTGCGIPNEDIGKLFDPFFTTNSTGRGMGLPVVMGIVKAHGGCMTVDSQPGQGSVFRIYLPISTEITTLEQEKTAVPARKIKYAGTVLLIEDEETVRDMAKIMLTRFGYTVIEARDGVEAVEIFQERQNEICCVLSDLTMPRMNGWETLAALRRMRVDVPVILTSGHEKDVVMAGNHPELPQVFLYKPYSMSALKEALAKATGG